MRIMTEIDRNTEPSNRDMDTVLRDFFRSEMPAPWPAFQQPKATLAAPHTPSKLSQYTWRFALAACIALLATGYFTLAGSFPRLGTDRGIDSMFHIGQKEKGPKVTQPPEADAPAPMGGVR